MCFDRDSLPPIPPLKGAAVSHDDLVLEARDGNRFAAFAATPEIPSGPGSTPRTFGASTASTRSSRSYFFAAVFGLRAVRRGFVFVAGRSPFATSPVGLFERPARVRSFSAIAAISPGA
jgi:hypothetical protein